MADLMCLRDWTTILDSEPCENPGHLAECSVVIGRRVAGMRFQTNFPEESEDDQRNAVVHELCHIYVDQTKVALLMSEAILSRGEYGLLYDAHQTAIEFAVDGLAGVIAPYLPLPSEFQRNWKAGKKDRG